MAFKLVDVDRRELPTTRNELDEYILEGYFPALEAPERSHHFFLPLDEGVSARSDACRSQL